MSGMPLIAHVFLQGQQIVAVHAPILSENEIAGETEYS
jgi:hypothetical protein